MDFTKGCFRMDKIIGGKKTVFTDFQERLKEMGDGEDSVASIQRGLSAGEEGDDDFLGQFCQEYRKQLSGTEVSIFQEMTAQYIG